MCLPVPWRIALVVTLLACFAFQTFLVYSDPTGREKQPLSDAALAGRKVWHDKNCQACHQLFGFGGFLGPDLTNAAPRLDRKVLGQLLTDGSRQMPAFRLDDEQIDNLLAFLTEVHRSGVGQARRPAEYLEPADFANYVDSAEMTAAERRGATRFMGTCSACHQPLKDNLLGNIIAPDLPRVTERKSENEILVVLKDGRPDKGMPAFGLADNEGRDIAAFLRWLEAHRDNLSKLQKGGAAESTPWFEYK